MPQRVPLAEINTNKRPNTEVSPGTRMKLWGRKLAGQSVRQIATLENLPKSTMHNAVTKTNTHNKGHSAPKSGRPRLRTSRDERRVISFAREHPKWTYKLLRSETGLKFSNGTFRKILDEHGLINWRAKKRPHLTKVHAQRRLEFALCYAGIDWSNYLFSDECSVEKGKGKEVVWSFGYPSEKWHADKIETYHKGKGLTVMVWAAIGTSIERTQLIVMERDETSPREGYSSISYTNTLAEGLVPIYDGQTFVQDNAPVHTSHYTATWLDSMGIHLMANFPPNSPDLNPIEHLWYHLKKQLYQLLPHLDDIQGIEQQRQLIINTLPLAWAAIRPDIIHLVLDSMNDRLQAVIDADGWQTRY